eukprot:SAG31_NODE_3931_length_3742_cov_2.127917_3_plen_93_part_00
MSTRASYRTVRPRTIVHGCEFALRSVATFEHEPIGAPAQVRRHKGERQGFALRILLGEFAPTIVHALLEVCADPRARLTVAGVAVPVSIAEI